MKLFTTIFFGLIAFTLGDLEIQPRIGGDPMTIPDLAKFNYQIGVYYVNKYGQTQLCSGILIHPKIVLTAAHCVTDAVYVALFMGTIVRPDTLESIKIKVYRKDIVIHENYDGVLNDIAIIKLDEALSLSKYVGVIPLPPKDFDCNHGVGWVSGWGNTNNTYGYVPEIMHFAEVSPTECPFDQSEPIRICTSASNFRNICKGDSGGALAMEDGNGGRYACGVNLYNYMRLCINDVPREHTSVQYYYNNGWICENSDGLVGC